VKRLIVGSKLPQQLIGHARGQAQGSVNSIPSFVLRRCGGGDEKHARADQQATLQHGLASQEPSAFWRHAPQTSPSSCAVLQARRTSSNEVLGRSSCIHFHSWVRARFPRSTS